MKNVIKTNGQKMSVAEYVNSARKVQQKKFYLGKISNIKHIDNGRIWITPCWSESDGDDNVVAYLSCNHRLAKTDICVGSVVIFGIAEEKKTPGRYMALGVELYTKEVDNLITERPDDWPINVSSSRKLSRKPEEPVVEDAVKDEEPVVEATVEEPASKEVVETSDECYEDYDLEYEDCDDYDEYDEYDEYDSYYEEEQSTHHKKFNRKEEK